MRQQAVQDLAMAMPPATSTVARKLMLAAEIQRLKQLESRVERIK